MTPKQMALKQMTPSPRAQRREEIRDQLLALIEDMLEAGQPFGDISVEHLTATAGMSRTRFYHYFEDRADLLQAWFDSLSVELAAAARPWWGATSMTRRQLRTVLVRLARAYRPHATLMAAVEAAATTEGSLRAALDRTAAAEATALAEHIERGQAAGTVDRGLDANPTAQWLTVLCRRGRAHLIRGADPGEVDHLAAAQAALIWNVLYDERGWGAQAPG